MRFMSNVREMLSRDDSRRGSISVMAAFFLIVIFAFTAFTVDLGYIVLVDQEMQGAVDGAALAAAQELQIAPDGSQDQVIDAAVDLASLNEVDDNGLSLNRRSDVEIGIWDEVSSTFTPYSGNNLSLANAVRVTGELNGERQNAVQLFFAPLLGENTHNVRSSAIAVIGRQRMRDVMLVIDCSGSMSSYNRMVYTRAAALILIDELGTDDRLGLAVYSYPVLVSGNNNSGNNRNNGRGRNRGRGGRGGGGSGGQTRLSGRLERQLQSNFQPTRARIPQLIPNLYASTTCIGGGMRVAIEEFQANSRLDPLGNPVEKVMVLMTDGHANETEPPGQNPVDSIYHYADVADQNDIIIHGITLGHSVDEVAIRDAAETTGGEYHHVPDGDFEGLFEIYRGIGRGGNQPRLVQ